jgi:hypothetical protein
MNLLKKSIRPLGVVRGAGVPRFQRSLGADPIASGANTIPQTITN